MYAKLVSVGETDTQSIAGANCYNTGNQPSDGSCYGGFAPWTGCRAGYYPFH